MAPRVPCTEFTKYKYLLLVCGFTESSQGLSTYRNSGSLIFMQDSQWDSLFRRFMHPYVHYVPVQHDLTDLPAKIRWARKHDAMASAIASRFRRLMIGLTPAFLQRHSIQNVIRSMSNVGL